LLILLVLITISCKSTPQNKVELPPEPQRQIQENPETIQEYAFFVAYLEFLIQEWEAWGETAKQAIKE
jgi:hypothetical protein